MAFLKNSLICLRLRGERTARRRRRSVVVLILSPTFRHSKIYRIFKWTYAGPRERGTALFSPVRRRAAGGRQPRRHLNVGITPSRPVNCGAATAPKQRGKSTRSRGRRPVGGGALLSRFVVRVVDSDASRSVPTQLHGQKS